MTGDFSGVDTSCQSKIKSEVIGVLYDSLAEVKTGRN